MLEISGKDQQLSTSIFSDCESAYRLIEEGNEKQAEKMFPLEYHLIKKYLYSDVSSLFTMLEHRLTISGS